MKQLYIPLISFLLFHNISTLDAQVLNNVSYIGQTSSGLLGLLNDDFPVEFNVDYYKIEYNTIDGQGNPIIASGGLAIPDGGCDTLPILTYCHGTVLQKLDVPSQDRH